MMFRGELYSHMHGVLMSSPIAFLSAEICMNWILDQTLSKGSKSSSMISGEKYQTKPSILNRFEYDVYCVIEDLNALNKIYKEISDINPNTNIKSKSKIDSSLAYTC